jgi:hypothetical protein
MGDEDGGVAARVQVELADGAMETWMVPLHLSDDALSYRATLVLPHGAVMLGVEPMKRRAGLQQEVVIARADVGE